MELRNNMLIDKEYYQEIQCLSPEEQGKLYKAIIDYGIARIEPELEGALLAIYRGIITRVQKAQEKYDRCVKNGQRGGRKSNQEHNQDDNQGDNQGINQGINQEANQEHKHIETETEKETETEAGKENESFPPANKNKNIFYLPSTKGAIPKTHTSKQRKPYLPPLYEYHKHDNYGEMFLFVADVLLEILEYSNEQEVIKFNGNNYGSLDVIQHIMNDGQRISEELCHKLINDKTIENKPLYILGAVLANKNT